MSIFRKTGSKWVNCAQCGEEFRSLTAVICQDCHLKNMRRKIAEKKKKKK